MMVPSTSKSSIPEASRATHEWPQPGLRTWLLTNAPSPYQAELLTAISMRNDVILTARFMRSSSTSGRAVACGFDSVTMAGLAPASWRDEVRLHPRAILEAALGRFDCFVLSGLYTSVTFLACACLLAIRRKPWIIWLERPRGARSFENRTQPVRRTSALARRFRDRIRRWLIRSSSRVLCIGTAAREEYRRLGATPEKLDVLPYCCDLCRYDEVAPPAISRIHDRWNLHDKTVFLFSGQLVPRKGVDTLIQGFERLAAESSNVALILLGDGHQRNALESQISPAIASRVHFLGHVPQEELPAVFRAADVFVFPSRHDGWGVVINEACASQLPIIASHQTGAARDLVLPGQNGFRHDAGDADAFYQSMKYLADHPDERAQMGRRSRELVEQFSPSAGAGLFADSVHRAVGRHPVSLVTEDHVRN